MQRRRPARLAAAAGARPRCCCSPRWRCCCGWACARSGWCATPRPTILGEALLLLLVALLGGKLCYLLATGLGNAIGTPPFDRAHVYDFAIPFAALALVAVALYGRAAGAAARPRLLAARRRHPRGHGWALVLYAMVGSLAAILAVDHFHFRQRSVMLRAGAVVGGVNVACVLMLAALAGGEPHGGELTLERGLRLRRRPAGGGGGGLLRAGARVGCSRSPPTSSWSSSPTPTCRCCAASPSRRPAPSSTR